jgi:predicted ATP-grasp superfamily ATP-dependent carboligase
MGEAKTKAEAKGGTGLNIFESRGVQNFNISIDKLVEMIKVETTQIKEVRARLKKSLHKHLSKQLMIFL